jgi:actin-related protein
MSAAQEYFERKGNGTVRATVPQPPHTPQRGIASTLSSPGGSYRAEDDHVILQVGARNLHAGFAGDSKPRCTISFGGLNARRVGDYRPWLPDYEDIGENRCSGEDWSKDRELWRMDTRTLDLDLVRDKLERALREIYTKHLLLDSKSRKVLLALPSLLPHSLISTLLSTLFTSFQVPTIGMLSLPLLTVLAAGQRSGIVVDVGWHETVVTSVYEYREIRQTRTVRAMKKITLAMGKLLEKLDRDGGSFTEQTISEAVAETQGPMDYDFDLVEDLVIRTAWCKCEGTDAQSADTLSSMAVEDDTEVQTQSTVSNSIQAFTVHPFASKLSHSLEIDPNATNALVESILLLRPSSYHEQDDEELSIPTLLHSSLRPLTPDVRALCLSNIVFTGGGINIPGLKTRIISELSRYIREDGWNTVRRTTNVPHQRTQKEREDGARSLERTSLSRENVGGDDAEVSVAVDANLNAQEISLRDPGSPEGRAPSSADTDGPSGLIRSVATLGPWAGASIAANLKIRGLVEVERETFLQSGLAGARNMRDSDIGAAKARQSLGAGLARGANDGSWTLGAWA